jgi:hypothetical protein
MTLNAAHDTCRETDVDENFPTKEEHHLSRAGHPPDFEACLDFPIS